MTISKQRISQEFFKQSIAFDGNGGMVYAATDWTTGVVRINSTSAEHENVIKNIEQWKHLLRCLVHEVYHVLQICSLPYLYLVSTNLCISFWQNDLDISSVPISEATIGASTVSDETRKVITHLEERISINGQAVSIEDIYEGAAYLADAVNVCNMTEDDYELRMRRLSSERSPYSNAFCLISSKIGTGMAMAVFPKIAVYALSTLHPREIFLWFAENICSICHDLTTQDGRAETHLKRAVDSLGKGGILADPYILTLSESAVNPFFIETLKYLYGKHDHATLIGYLSSPKDFPQDLFLDALRPMMFNDGYMIVPNHFGKGIFDSIDEHMNTLATLSMVAQAKLGAERIGPKLRKVDDN